MIIDFDWFQQDGVKSVLSMTYTVISIIRIVAPIALVIMTSLDIAKKVINPEEKEGQKKILIRLIAALIIFFIPTFINLVFKIADIEETNIDTSSSPSTSSPQYTPSTSTNITPKPTPNETEPKLTNIKINNCPDALSTYHNGDNITLNTNIPSSFTGRITWSIEEGGNFVQTNPLNNNKSLDVSVINASSINKVVIKVTADGVSNTCIMYVDKEKLDSVSYTNCPGVEKYYNVGETIELKTDIKSSYQGDIVWTADEINAVNITPSADKRKAKITLVDQPAIGYVIVKTFAGYKASVCLINISAVKELKITNCPSKNKKYHVGDTFILNSNIPSFYKGTPNWQSVTSPEIFKIKPIDNGRSAEITILDVPELGSAAIGLGADLKGTSCLVYIE